MKSIDWETNSYLEMQDEKLREEYDKFTNKGWMYFPSGATPEFISFWMNPFSREDLEKALDVKLIFGNAHQIHLLNAIEFFKVGFAYWNRFSGL
jgi:hypothetical protein